MDQSLKKIIVSDGDQFDRSNTLQNGQVLRKSLLFCVCSYAFLLFFYPTLFPFTLTFNSPVLSFFLSFILSFCLSSFFLFLTLLLSFFFLSFLLTVFRSIYPSSFRSFFFFFFLSISFFFFLSLSFSFYLSFFPFLSISPSFPLFLFYIFPSFFLSFPSETLWNSILGVALPFLPNFFSSCKLGPIFFLATHPFLLLDGSPNGQLLTIYRATSSTASSPSPGLSQFIW